MSAITTRVHPLHGKPVWDAATQTLWLEGALVKRFRRDTLLQAAVLAAFQEQAWPRLISFTPEPRAPLCPKCRLRNTIRNLNRSLRPRLHFWQEACGTRIGWELAPPPAPPAPGSHFRPARPVRVQIIVLERRGRR